jgi:hypothetical protein
VNEIEAVSVNRGLVVLTKDGSQHRTMTSQASLLGDFFGYPRAHRAASPVKAWIDAMPHSEFSGWERTWTFRGVILPVAGAVLGAAVFAVIRTIFGMG